LILIDDLQGLGGTFLRTFAARDALERLHLVSMMKHRLIRAKAHTGQAAHTDLFVHPDDASLILRKRARRANLDALAALNTKDGAEITRAIIVDADVGFPSIGDLMPGLGASLFAHQAADAEIRIIG
jgi:hypothetical protein